MKLTYSWWSRLNGGDGPPQSMNLRTARTLARASRHRGYYVISATVQSYACPLDASRPVDLADRHRIEVHHHPWESVTTPMIDKAMIEHLTDPDDETRCRWVVRDSQDA